MTSTGFAEFDTTIQKTNEILKEIEDKLGWVNRRNQSYSILRAVLHTLRDLLLPDEAVQLGEQLPTLLRGVYFEGWEPSQTPRKANRAGFLMEIRGHFTFSVEENIEFIVGIVLTALKKHISLGEAEDIKSELPKDIRQMVGQYI